MAPYLGTSETEGKRRHPDYGDISNQAGVVKQIPLPFVSYEDTDASVQKHSYEPEGADVA